jgi:hypothetical protein
LYENGIRVEGSLQEAAAFVRRDLHHHGQAQGVPLSASSRRLLQILRALKGPHARLPDLSLPPESRGVASVLESTRRTWGWVGSFLPPSAVHREAPSAKGGTVQ